MIIEDRTKIDLSLQDRVFSWSVGRLQSSIVKVGVTMRKRKRANNIDLPSPAFDAKLRSLGLQTDKLWWGPMTLFPRKMEFLVNRIEQNPPKSLLEIGSGTTTPIFTALGRKLGFSVLSIENHQGTIDYVVNVLNSSNLDSGLRIQKCSFGTRKLGPLKYRWYNADLTGSKFDFVFIDGPMSRLVGRCGALPEIARVMEEVHEIYLDDCTRQEERRCIDLWCSYFDGLDVSYFPECRGVARLMLGAL